jgi:hypothetical protein
VRNGVVASLVLALSLVAAPACIDGEAALHRAARELREGQSARARDLYVELAGSAKSPSLRVRAALGAARASRAMKDDAAVMRWLRDAAAVPAVAGVSEEAYLEYADALRLEGERSQALNYYYRAAAGAERHLNRGYIYERAIQAITALGMSR